MTEHTACILYSNSFKKRYVLLNSGTPSIYDDTRVLLYKSNVSEKINDGLNYIGAKDLARNSFNRVTNIFKKELKENRRKLQMYSVASPLAAMYGSVQGTEAIKKYVR